MALRPHRRHGPGTLMLASGDFFEGHWVNDVKHGPGTFFFLSKGCRCVGVHTCHGVCVRTRAAAGCSCSGRADTPVCARRYDGVWHQGDAKRGSYSEVQPAPPGAPGALPNIELCSPELVLAAAEADAAAAVAAGCARVGASMPVAGAGAEAEGVVATAACAGDGTIG